MNPFTSFWWAGYECSDKLNAFGNRVDLLSATAHISLLHNDYKSLAAFNIKTVREGIRWSFVEKQPYRYDWSVVTHMIEAAARYNIQQVWDICHFGFPDDLTPLHPLFPKRFAALCRAFVEVFRSFQPDAPLIVTPINEVSFLSWLGGDVKGTSPYCTAYGWEVKYHLMRAYIEGVAAMREADPSVIILSTEPLVNYVPALNPSEESIAKANALHEFQYQATDILCGRMCPELGGKPEYLNFAGLNFYYNNQWIGGDTLESLPWNNPLQDERWRPLSSLLKEVYERYNKPLVLAETSHCGIDKPHWLIFIATECAKALQQDVDLLGVCLYPIIDRPDWDQLDVWHDAGLWSIDPNDKALKRVLHEDTAQALVQAQIITRNALREMSLPEIY